MSAMSACVGFNPGAPAPGNGRSNADGVPVKTLLSLSTVSGVAEVAQDRHRVHLIMGVLCRHTLMQCLLELDQTCWVFH